jgi:hypothetical protein
MGVQKLARLSAECLIPESEFGVLLFRAVLDGSSGLSLSKKHVLELFQLYAKRYAVASRIMKFLVPQIQKYEHPDMKTASNLVASFTKDVIEANMKNLICHASLVDKFLGALTEYDARELPLIFLTDIIQAMASNFRPLSIMRQDVWCRYVELAVKKDIDMQSRIAILLIVPKLVLPLGNTFEAVYGDVVFADHFGCQEIDPFLNAMFQEIMRSNSPFLAKRLGLEFSIAVRNGSFEGLNGTFHGLKMFLNDSNHVSDFEAGVVFADLKKVFEWEPSDTCDMKGVELLIERLIKLKKLTENDIEELKAIAERFPERPLNALVLTLVTQI